MGRPATATQLVTPEGLTYFNNGLYVADSGNSRIRRIDLTTGIITTVAGNGTPYFAGDGGPATAAQIAPYNVTFDVAGNMYISDRGNARIRIVNASGIINTITGARPHTLPGDGGRRRRRIGNLQSGERRYIRLDGLPCEL